MTRALGIIGGMSWVSTAAYYEKINRTINSALGKQHSAELWLASVDFQNIVDAQVNDQWERAGEILAAKAKGLETAGASAILIASNTMHKVLAPVRAAVKIPALDIFKATADAIRAAGHSQVGLLGTRYTMNDPFFKGEYARHGLNIVVPDSNDRKAVNEVIFRELIHAKIRPESAQLYVNVIAKLAQAGATAVIFGCTEIGLLLRPEQSPLPVFDTTELHVASAVAWLSS